MTTTFNEMVSEVNIQKDSADFFKILLELKDYAIILINPAGDIINWNLGAECIYGYTANEMIGGNTSLLFSSAEVVDGLPLEILNKAIETGRYEFEGWRIKKDKTAFYANTIITVLYNANGAIKGFAKITRDITLQKKLEEENKILTDKLEEKVKQRTKELEIVNKELEAFSYSVSHDLRAPLRAIGGYSAILKEDYGTLLDKEGNRIIDVIVSNSDMMSKLIDDLLTFSRMARLEVVNAAVNMNNLVKRCISELIQFEKVENYKFELNNLPECRGDENMLKQVWFNLISNALKYSAKVNERVIEIGSTKSESNIIYYVKDNGTGFDMKYSKNLFGVFQRLHRQDEFEGTGLGLALTKRIVTKHGGEIWVESALQQGATFYFSIPV